MFEVTLSKFGILVEWQLGKYYSNEWYPCGVIGLNCVAR